MSDTPECAVFDLCDFEVDGFGGCGLGVLDDDADGAGGEEVADGEGGEDDAVPVCEGVLNYWGEGAGHRCGCGLGEERLGVGRGSFGWQERCNVDYFSSLGK